MSFSIVDLTQDNQPALSTPDPSSNVSTTSLRQALQNLDVDAEEAKQATTSEEVQQDSVPPQRVIYPCRQKDARKKQREREKLRKSAMLAEQDRLKLQRRAARKAKRREDSVTTSEALTVILTAITHLGERFTHLGERMERLQAGVHRIEGWQRPVDLRNHPVLPAAPSSPLPATLSNLRSPTSGDLASPIYPNPLNFDPY
jgi:hypothetical protein